MKAEELISTALSQGRTALSEYQSKRLFAAYGLPVTRETLTQSADEAAAAAGELGWPVVLKACSPELLHKSEGGWIHLGLSNENEVRTAYDLITTAPGPDLDGVLVQEMVSGQRELVLGLIRDPQFGPCVMLGLGGIMTEILRDMVFRMAPLDLVEAEDMVEEMRSRALLDAFRGQAPADMDTLCQSLTALGRMGIELEAVMEIDVNPMIVAPVGRLKAVDGLVVLTGGQNA